MTKRESDADDGSPPERPAAGGGSNQADPNRSATGGQPHESGGPSGPEPTRFGDWERKGRCIDF